MVDLSKSTVARDVGPRSHRDGWVTEVLGRDGKTYTYRSERDRLKVIREVHRLRCCEDLTIREVRQSIVDRGFRLSLGTTANYIDRWQCSACSGVPSGTPEQVQVGGAQ